MLVRPALCTEAGCGAGAVELVSRTCWGQWRSMNWDLLSVLDHAMEFLGFPRLLCPGSHGVLPSQTAMAAVAGQSPRSFE